MKNKGHPLSKNSSPTLSSKLYWSRISIYLDCVVYPSPFPTCLGHVSTYIVHAMYVWCNQSLDACNYYIFHDVIQIEIFFDRSMSFVCSSPSFRTCWIGRQFPSRRRERFSYETYSYTCNIFCYSLAINFYITTIFPIAIPFWWCWPSTCQETVNIVFWWFLIEKGIVCVCVF